MLIAALPSNEDARVRLLRGLAVLDTPAEEVFDRITRVLAQLLHVPVALVSLVDVERQWFKSRVGLDVCETSRDLAFCSHALHADDVLIVEDALEDHRFFDNPLVIGAPFIRFYVGVPLRSSEGFALGTLCAIDIKPRVLSHGELSALRDLGKTVERELLQREVAGDMQTVQRGDRRALAISESRFAAVFRQTPTGKAIVDLDGKFIEVNPKLCEITGYSQSELLTKTFASITVADDLADDLQLVADLLFGRRQSYRLEKRYVHKNGHSVWIDLSVALVRDADGEPLHFISVVQDIGIRKESEAILRDYQLELERRVQMRTAELESSRETLKTITDNLPILIAQVDGNLRYRFNNAMYHQVFGTDPVALRGKLISETLDSRLYQELLPCFERALAGERVTHDHVQYSIQQTRIWSATYMPDIRDGEVVGFYVMSQDVTERKRAEKLMHDKAMCDSLTSLPNRRALKERVDEAIAAGQHDGVPFAVFFMDLDGFKAVNDRHGHDAGDALLKQVADRLRKTVRQGDFICRLAGDEFVIVSTGIPTASACARVAQDICRALSRPFALPCAEVTIGTSVGIALCPAAAETSAEALVTRADAAMYEAKRKGRNGYRFSVDITPIQERNVAFLEDL
jgi:diguanylate cyclase (GGDEF)-like protein/PAS domain S-box-containing protein